MDSSRPKECIDVKKVLEDVDAVLQYAATSTELKIFFQSRTCMLRIMQ